MPIPTFTITLKHAEMIAPKVRHLVFTRDDGAPFTFIPGQFITIHFEHEGKILKRSYSLANDPLKGDFIEFAAGYFPGGPGTELLFHLQAGEQLTSSGPFGKLILRNEKPKRYILVATSTGVTPFRTMLSELEPRMQTEDLKVVLLLGVQRREDLIYGSEFIELAEKMPNFSFRAHYSREPNLIRKPYEYEGHVQLSFPELELNPTEDIVYLCGNPLMIDQAFTTLRDCGFEVHNIRREKYISSK
jgi:ferredoxin-NADP reductase